MIKAPLLSTVAGVEIRSLKTHLNEMIHHRNRKFPSPPLFSTSFSPVIRSKNVIAQNALTKKIKKQLLRGLSDCGSGATSYLVDVTVGPSSKMGVSQHFSWLILEKLMSNSPTTEFLKQCL